LLGPDNLTNDSTIDYTNGWKYFYWNKVCSISQWFKIANNIRISLWFACTQKM